MASQNETAKFETVNLEDEELNLDGLESVLQAELEEKLSELAFLEEEKAMIGNPKALGEVIMGEVLTQFGNQIGLDMTNETLIQE